MPRLSDPTLTKGNARWALLKLYRSDPNFMKEVESLRNPYMALIDRFSVDALTFSLSADISSKEFYQAILAYRKGESERNPLPYEQFYEQFPYFDQFQPYFDGLHDLAYRWNLRAPWAVLLLFYCDIVDCWKAKGMPSEFDIPLEKFDSLFPWEPPALPLTITVPAWAVVVRGRRAVLEEVAGRLKQYENQIKAAGLKEYPSALKTHARWWFEHYVHRKRYDDIAQEETYTPGGSLIAYAKNVGDAVRRFSKLIGIDAKELK